MSNDDVANSEFRITPEFVTGLTNLLADASAGRWSVVHTEIQFGGKNVLIVLEVSNSIDEESVGECEKQLQELIGPRLPPMIEELGTWTIILRHDGRPIGGVDSLNYMFDHPGA